MNDFWSPTEPTNIVFLMLIVAVFLSLVRLVRGPGLPDRVIALDLIMVLAVSFIGVYTVATNETVYLDGAIVLALIAFAGTVAFARYLERRSWDE